MELLSKITRFRAYHLGVPGSLFSYFDGTTFTLIEAKLTVDSINSLNQELKLCNRSTINTLHITSWDEDHCDNTSLSAILSVLKPQLIEYPGYQPKTDCGKESLQIISSYNSKEPFVSVCSVTPTVISNLPYASNFEYQNVFFTINKIYDNSNDNSLVKLFRTGSFTVASLGDVECTEISEMLMNCKIFNSEVDVMILAHHGADNGFTSEEFLKKISPSVTVSSSNYDNQYEHPKAEIKKMLYDNSIPIYTTKTGDVIIKSINNHYDQYKVINLKANSSEISSEKTFTTKRYQHYISPLLRSILKYK